MLMPVTVASLLDFLMFTCICLNYYGYFLDKLIGMHQRMHEEYHPFLFMKIRKSDDHCSL